jgi:hypothetical protein
VIDSQASSVVTTTANTTSTSGLVFMRASSPLVSCSACGLRLRPGMWLIEKPVAATVNCFSSGGPHRSARPPGE